ncbi:MAG: DHH family phosphoesterase [Sphingobacteriia bacterium 24-36-13]|jgi:phosphoesterase RecJ-like protein|uniref:DHH family phosphoesterase n=1 Tax=Sediminibacterium sp. TaxID=1917865 RepID=UPI000BCDFD60|nr:bifunctional oligoribonuclease/PAP phosphatase NrnA [Sediminibacterium sp.]OYY12125.1 MAG: DHH family phosphoesterase [Sphingobacteriia bacterium 35-36-14]OYZ55700.1 MAG: DHH family phosphoesterase [Sphingobacteriia bacterium 24-36-13]OZA65378.1 MAG: DHH family phosphoesterase [Sphingobacteriia bacterium 39-36-14]HQS23225.1 bifunctional oligoribonuclease/PAP phosphatase NrnA [Sediminibacterium sp.]HQS34794.1 bifunctional oligoribonuclease/PAP phosphatase NrnA [Sediminibacterium sp.]
MQLISQFYPLLSQPKQIVITMHQKPDGDAMGSTLGLYHFLRNRGHHVTVISPTNWADFLEWLPGIESVINFEGYREKCLGILDKADILFCLDFNIFHRTKHLAPFLAAAKAIKVLIDHHEQPDEPNFDYGISDTGKSSTCEMVYDFIVEAGGREELTQDIATCLYTGTMTDTGSFRFPSTKASVHRMVAELKETGFDHSQVHNHIYDNFLESRLRFIGFALLNRMEVLYEYNTAIMYIHQADLQKYHIKTGDTEGLVNYLLTIKGIRFGAIVIDRAEERKWSFRSKGGFDVNQFARNHFEGGGHANASGGRSSDSVEKTVEHFKQVIQEYKNQLQ